MYASNSIRNELERTYIEFTTAHLEFIRENIKSYENIWAVIFSFDKLNREFKGIKGNILDKQNMPTKLTRIIQLDTILEGVPWDPMSDHTINSMTFLEIPFSSAIFKKVLPNFINVLENYSNPRFIIITHKPFYLYELDHEGLKALKKLVNLHIEQTGIPPLHLSELIHKTLRILQRNKNIDNPPTFEDLEKILSSHPQIEFEKRSISEIKSSAEWSFKDLWLVGLNPRIVDTENVSPQRIIITIYHLHELFCKFIDYGPALYESSHSNLRRKLNVLFTEKLAQKILENTLPKTAFQERALVVKGKSPKEVLKNLESIVIDFMTNKGRPRCHEAVKYLEELLKQYYSQDIIDIEKIEYLIEKFRISYGECTEDIEKLEKLVIKNERMLTKTIGFVSSLLEILSNTPPTSTDITSFAEALIMQLSQSGLELLEKNPYNLERMIYSMKETLGVRPPPLLIKK